MAKAISDGARTIDGIEVDLKYYETAENLAKYDAIAIGTPTYNHDTVSDIKKLLEEVSEKTIDLRDKVGASFGSYGWSGEAPQMILETMRNNFEMKILESPLLIRYTPDQKGLEKCRDLGKRIAESIN